MIKISISGTSEQKDKVKLLILRVLQANVELSELTPEEFDVSVRKHRVSRTGIQPLKESNE